MRIKAVVFDIGQTLVHYPIPLNWSALYRPAFEHIEQKLGLDLSEEAYEHIGKTLAKYNARINPREKEVSSDLIFSEILEGTGIPEELKETVKKEFYDYFRCEAHVYPEAEEALAELAGRGIITATLSDVAYGMDNKYALEDIRPLLKYIRYPYTSNDTGSPGKSPLSGMRSRTCSAQKTPARYLCSSTAPAKQKTTGRIMK